MAQLLPEVKYIKAFPGTFCMWACSRNYGSVSYLYTHFTLADYFLTHNQCDHRRCCLSDFSDAAGENFLFFKGRQNIAKFCISCCYSKDYLRFFNAVQTLFNLPNAAQPVMPFYLCQGETLWLNHSKPKKYLY